jgi:pimeloyl-ACP methyl ester carboxylesterase
VADQPPVVLVHAITGAVLRDEYPQPPDPVWDPGLFGVEAFDRIAIHPESATAPAERPLYEAQGPSRVMPSHSVRAIYGELVDLLRRELPERGEPAVPVYVFAYDWRQDNRLSAARLGDFIREVIDRSNLLRRYAGQCEAVDLVGHSMGGLVIAACLAAGKHLTSSGRPQVRRVVTLGTPYLGAVDALAKFATGESEIVGQRRHTEREIARLTPAVYQLLPVYERAFFDLATQRTLDLFDSENWQPSIVDSIALSIQQSSTRPDLSAVGAVGDALRATTARRLLDRRLESCRDLHQDIDGLDPDELLLERNGWLPLVGIDRKTRFAAAVSDRTDPNTGRTKREFDFLVGERDYEGEERTPASFRDLRLRLGDGVVPIHGAVPRWIKRECVVCVAERDFRGLLDFQEMLVRKFTSLHVTLPLMNLVQRWVMSFLKGERWGEIWGRPLPDVAKREWRSPVAGAETRAD